MDLEAELAQSSRRQQNRVPAANTEHLTARSEPAALARGLLYSELRAEALKVRAEEAERREQEAIRKQELEVELRSGLEEMIAAAEEKFERERTERQNAERLLAHHRPRSMGLTGQGRNLRGQVKGLRKEMSDQQRKNEELKAVIAPMATVPPRRGRRSISSSRICSRRSDAPQRRSAFQMSPSSPLSSPTSNPRSSGPHGEARGARRCG